MICQDGQPTLGWAGSWLEALAAAAVEPVPMGLELKPQSLPLVEREGALLLAGTRVTLDSVLHAFQRGATAEEISLHLPDVYAAISVYLHNMPDVDAYLKQRAHDAERIRQENQARWPSSGLRERLLNRQKK